MFLHTRQSSAQKNKYQVSQKHSCFSWWWTHSRPKHVCLVCRNICFCISDSHPHKKTSTKCRKTVFSPDDGPIVARNMSVWYSGAYVSAYQSPTKKNKHQMSQKHSCFSWWWTHSRPEHAEIGKYTKNKSWTKLVYLQDCTEMHSQQNIKNTFLCDSICCFSFDALSITQDCLDDVTQFVQVRSERPTVL